MSPLDLVWLLSLITIAGAILITRKNRIGFIIWFVANTGWIIFNFYTHTYQQIPIWIAFNILNIYGLYYWTKHKESDTDGKKSSEE